METGYVYYRQQPKATNRSLTQPKKSCTRRLASSNPITQNCTRSAIMDVTLDSKAYNTQINHANM